jgi:UDPglucose 6-dehydrogenase
MRITVMGTGYVGLVVGACLAETGNDVVCVDTDEGKIAGLQNGKIPIFEPGLEPMVQRNEEFGRLRFSTDLDAMVAAAEVVVIAVGTPAGEDGSADLQYVLSAADTIGRNMTSEKVVLIKSTVPVGTAAKVRATIEGHTDQMFTVCSNPEFLKEGAAVGDFMKPDRVIVGLDSPLGRPVIERLYAPFLRTSNRMIFMDNVSAELTKYAANAMLATRISFMNEIANLCETLGADVDMIRRGLGSDSRIGSAFLFPGPGYGGSCFPKDMKALISTGDEHGTPLKLVKAVDKVNTRQRRRMYKKLKKAFDGQVEGKKVAVWGLAFKAETDDIRESAAIDLVDALLDKGASVSVFDPQAMEPARKRFGDRVRYATDPYDALTGADALAVATEWLVFRNPDFDRIKASMSGDVLVDGRNLYDPAQMRDLGFAYQGIGRA